MRSSLVAVFLTALIALAQGAKYPKYKAAGKEVIEEAPRSNIALGNFVPDKENNGSAVRFTVHLHGGQIPDMVESEEPIFGREFPDNRAIEGTFTPEDRRGSLKPPIHGVLIPVRKYRGYFIKDGASSFHTFHSTNKDIPSVCGFLMTHKETDVAMRFYPESFIGWMPPSPKKPYPQGKLHGHTGRMILRKHGPSVFFVESPGAPPLVDYEAVFKDDEITVSKSVIVIPEGGVAKEIISLEDMFIDGHPPVKGTVSSPLTGKDYKVTVVQSRTSGSSHDLLFSSEVEPKPITIVSSEEDGTSVKGFALLPPDQNGPPMDKAQLVFTDGWENIPPRIQITLTMLSDKSTVVGLLISDFSYGPYFFYPGKVNPGPTLRKPGDKEIIAERKKAKISKMD